MIIKFYQNYLIRPFLKELVIVFFVFMSLIFILNIISEVRYFMNLDLGFYYPIFITLLNLPSVIFEIFPFIILISTQLFFVKLYEKNELIILKNYGIDNIKLLNILILTAIIIGLLITTVFYTFSSSLKHSYLYFKNQHSNDQKYLAVVNQNGLWIKDEIENKINIINADRIEKYELKTITISQLDLNFNLIKTIKASSANIVKNEWILKNTEIFTIGEPKIKSGELKFNTNFNVEKINNMFSDLSSLNFFELFSLHKDYKLFGYSTTEIESHLHKLYSLSLEIKMSLKDYNFHKLQKELLNFCTLDLSSFYFDIRKDTLYCDEVSSQKRKSCVTLLNVILECLLKWYAPVLSFTTEEITDLSNKNKKISIHEETFPELPKNWQNETLYKKWEKLLSFRQQVNIAIEEKRSKKIIGSSLEANVKISLSKKDHEILNGVDAEELFITSNVTKTIQNDIKDQLLVSVEKADGTKCARCWKIVSSANKNKCSRTKICPLQNAGK